MGDSACELADGLEFLRLERKFTRRFELLLGLFALGNVAGDLGKADDVSVVVANGINDDMRPKTRSVFTDAPAFSFKPALLPGRVKRQLGNLRNKVLVRVKPGEVLADDLVGSIPF